MPKIVRKPSEGTRLLRAAFIASGCKTILEFGRRNGVDDRSYMSRLLSGERKPGLQLGARWERELGIAIASWGEEPTAALPEIVPPPAPESGEIPAAEAAPTGTHEG